MISQAFNILAWLNIDLLNLLGINLGIKITILVALYALAMIGWWFIGQNKKRIAVNIYAKTLNQFLQALQEAGNNADDLSVRQAIDNYFNQLPEQEKESNEKLQHAWKEFTEGIQRYKEKDMNVYQAEAFFHAKLLIDPVISPIKHLPGFATSFGLLFTFLALTAGLSELHYNEATKLVDDGLGSFINALAAKFITSLSGLGIALWLDALIRKKEKKLTATLDGIVYQLNHSFIRLTAQHILIGIQADVHQLPQTIGDYLDKTSTDSGLIRNIEAAIKTGIEGSVAEIKTEIAKVSTAMEGFSTAGMEGMTETLEKLGNDLKAGLTEGISGDLTQLTQIMEALPVKITEAMNNIDSSIGAMKVSMSDTQEQMLMLVKEVFGTLQNTQGEKLEALLETFLTKSDTLTAQLVAQQQEMQTKHEASMGVINTMVEGLESTGNKQQQQLGSTLEKQLTEISTQFNSVLDEFKQATETQQASLTGNVSAVMEKIAQSGETFNTQLQESLTTVLQELQASVGAFSAVSKQFPQQLTEGQAQLNQAFGKLEQLLNTEFTTFVKQQNTLTAQQQTALQTLAQYLTQVAQLQAESAKMQGVLEQIIQLESQLATMHTQQGDSAKDQLNTLRYALEQQKETIQQHQTVVENLTQQYGQLDSVAQKIATSFGEAGTVMASSIVDVKTASTGYFSEFSQKHTEAIRSLTNFVEQLQETTQRPFVGTK